MARRSSQAHNFETTLAMGFHISYTFGKLAIPLHLTGAHKHHVLSILKSKVKIND